MNPVTHDAAPTFVEAARFWLRLGFVSFGGPAGQIAIMHREVVERRGWLDEQEFTAALNFCMLLPGPEALQLAIYLGWKLHGARGGLVAGLGFIGPAVVLLLGLSFAYASYGSLPAANGILLGLKAVVVALVVEALIRIGRRALGRPLHVALAVTSFVALQWLRVPFPLIVLAAGAVGLAVAWRVVQHLRFGNKMTRTADLPGEPFTRLMGCDGIRRVAPVSFHGEKRKQRSVAVGGNQKQRRPVPDFPRQAPGFKVASKHKSAAHRYGGTMSPVSLRLKSNQRRTAARHRSGMWTG